MSINFNENILLTGAGFTANFGGPLAREMWSKILNNPKIDNLPEIKNILLSNFDFEDVYSNVLSGTSTKEDKDIFQSIMVEAYSDIDETIKSYTTSGFSQYGCHWNNVSSFLALFNGVGGKIGAHFTLNQDFLLERGCHRIPLGITGLKYGTYRQSISGNTLGTNDRISLYTEAELDEFKEKYLPSEGSMYYIKLHGSQGWISSQEDDLMIIGKNKVEDINREPILKWYFELLKESLMKPNTKLFVIGYSFRDQHVNDCIINAIENHGLKLYVISPEDPEALKKRLRGEKENLSYEVDNHNSKIWNAINGYYPHKLADIFPSDQTKTQAAKALYKILGQ